MRTHDGIDNIALCNVNRVKEIFLKHGDFLKIIINLHIEDKDDAEEFFQELFLFFIVKPLPENIKNIQGLLSKIVSDRAKDYYRKKAGTKRRLNKYSEIISKKAPPNSPEATIIDKEESDRFYNIIKMNLSPQEAQAVTLKFRQQNNNIEIAEKMKIDPRSVSRYVSVGLKKLKKLWA